MADQLPPDNSDSTNADSDSFLLPRSNYNVAPTNDTPNPAADLIRNKLSKIYAAEPDLNQEEQEAEAAHPRSKHQQFMHELTHSGKSLAQVQTEWHNYYVSLPDTEKHTVWQEFYASSQVAQQPTVQLPAATPTHTETLAAARTEMAAHDATAKQARSNRRDASTIQHEIREHARGRKLTAKQHLHSLLFGLGFGVVAVIVMLFGFFNEVFIAPFIQPARNSTAAPLIVSTDTVAPSSTPQVIIPKINVQIPLNFDESSTNEATIENDLEGGVVHYPTTAMPGQNGNAAFFGHSSNNIFNKGKYKFAFVLLHELVPGDTFYITKDSKVYAYKVFSKTVVDPSDVGVLNAVDGHTATATLITCDPPGTSLHRLVVVGDQISPDPSGNSNATLATAGATAAPTQLVGNGPTLWGRFISQTYGKAIIGLLGVGVLVLFFRSISGDKRRRP